LVAQEALTGEVKCFLSNAPPAVPLKKLLCVAFSRCSIERLFEDGKGEVGFDHFEVRSYRALVRHLVLTTLSLYFLSEQVQRLGGKKRWVDALPSTGRRGGAVGPGHAARGTNQPAARCGAKD
jgi:SRSO17 transposase